MPDISTTLPKAKYRKYFFLIPALCAAVAGAGYWWQTARFLESTDNAYLQSDIVYISAKQAGFAKADQIKDNQRVHKGDILARIEDRDYQLKAEESRAAVLSAEASINQLQSQLVLQQSLIQAAEANKASTLASRTLAATELARTRSLFDKGMVSADSLDNARAQDQKYQALLEGDQANLQSTRGQLAVLNSQLEAAEASRQQAEIRLAIARHNLSETIITAPRNGIIGQRQVQDGQLVKSGSVMYTLVDNETIWVTANFKETQVAHMRKGQPAELEIDAFPGTTVTGYIDSLWPASGARFSLLPPENATGNFTRVVQRIPVKIMIPAGQPLAGQLRAGMSVVATVDTRAVPEDLSQLAATGNNLEPDVTNRSVISTGEPHVSQR